VHEIVKLIATVEVATSFTRAFIFASTYIVVPYVVCYSSATAVISVIATSWTMRSWETWEW
jgi:hypothetical protein